MTKRWEYKLEILELDKDDADHRQAAASPLDALGHQGWEAVGFSPSHASSHGLRLETTRFVVLLKRPVT